MTQDDIVSLFRQRSSIMLVLAEIASDRERELRESVRDVEVVRGLAGFGFTVASNQEGLRPRIGVLVHGGTAAQTGHVFGGDRILQLNDDFVWDKTHQEIVDMIRSSGSRIRLTLEGDTSPMPAALTSSPKAPRRASRVSSRGAHWAAAFHPGPSCIPRRTRSTCQARR